MKTNILIAALMGIIAAGIALTSSAGEDGLTKEEAQVYLIFQQETEGEPDPDQRERMFYNCVLLLSGDKS